MLGVVVAALIEAFEVPGTSPLQAAVIALAALAARAKVTPTTKLGQ